jgi:hypothetical protein
MNLLATKAQPIFPIMRKVKVVIIHESATSKLKNLKIEYNIPCAKKTSEYPNALLNG